MAGDFPDIPFVQAAGDGGPRSTTQMVVVHATDNTASDEAEASYATHRPDRTSAHFYSDEDSVIQGVQLSHVAYGCYPIGNSRSVQFELAGLSNHLTDATLRRIAPIVRRVCDRYGIPIQHVGPAELRAGQLGICGHGDVTLAWGQGTHTDPGASFPWSTFIGYVDGASAPPQLAPQEDDMYLVNVLVGAAGPAQKNFNYLGTVGAWHYIATKDALAWVKAQGFARDLGTMWDAEARDRFGIGDPAELEQIKQAAGAGVAAAVPAIVDALVAKLPVDAMSRADIEAAVHHAIAGATVTTTITAG